MTPDVYFNFHDLLRIRAVGLNDALHAALVGTFKNFQVESFEAQADIEVLPIGEEISNDMLNLDTKNLSRYWVHEHEEGVFSIVSCYRGEMDLLIRPGQTIYHYFRPERRAGGKLVGSLYLSILLALQQKQATLFKAAVLDRGGQSVAISGVSGAGKTTFLLHLLQEGWDYLSDNTCLLHEQTAYAFREKIVYNYHHVEAHSEIFENVEATAEHLSKARRKNWLRDLSRKHLPTYLLESPRIKNFTDPYLSQKPQVLFPKATIYQKRTPSFYLLLVPGHHLQVKRISLNEAVSRYNQLHHVSYPEFSNLSGLYDLVAGQFLLDFEPALRQSFAGMAIYQVTLPGHIPFQERYVWFKLQLDRLLSIFR